MEKPLDFNSFTAKAELLKSIAHPIRLCIIKGLVENGECNVNHMQTCLNVPQSTISQHLSKMRALGIVKPRREGVEVYYQVVDEEIVALIQLLFPMKQHK